MNQRRRPSAQKSASSQRAKAGSQRSSARSGRTARESAVAAASKSSSRQRVPEEAPRQARQSSQRRAASSAKAPAPSPTSNRPAARSSERSARVSERSPRVSGRQSNRHASAPSSSMLGPILIFIVIAAALGGGAYYALQGEDHSIRINQLLKAYTSANKNMKESIEEGSLDMAKDYYKKGSDALETLSAYISQHEADIVSDIPDTKDKQQSLDDMKAQLPTLEKVAGLRNIASQYQVRLNTLHRVYDLDALERQINDFRSNPPLDGVQLDATAQALFNKQVGFLKDASKTIGKERTRRKTGFKKPVYKADNRNDLQKRNERADYQGFNRNVPYKLEKNKFSDAYKTALAFHDKYPSCDIDEDWEKITSAEASHWSQVKSSVSALIQKGSAADLQRAQSQLSIFLDNYGNESFGDEARSLYAKCSK